MKRVVSADQMLAYNLHNWFKLAILPSDWIHYEIKTIRRRFYQLAANVSGQGSYQHIRYARDQDIERLITGIIDRLRRFSLVQT